MEGFAARKEREEREAAPRIAFGPDEITGKYEGAELDELRELRPTNDRIRRLETKHDELKGDLKDVRGDVKALTSQVSDLREDVAGAVGKLDGQETVLTEMLGIVRQSAQRDHVTFTAKVDVDKAHELAKIEVGKAQDLDTVDARSTRRKVILKAVGFVAGGGGLIEVLHRLGIL